MHSEESAPEHQVQVQGKSAVLFGIFVLEDCFTSVPGIHFSLKKFYSTALVGKKRYVPDY